LSIIFFAIAGGTIPVPRTSFSLPLAFAFMFYFIIDKYKNKISKIIICFALLTAVYQIKITTQLFYSDQLRYNNDVKFACELSTLINSIKSDNKDIPVILIGRYHAASQFPTKNFLQGEVIGHSNFEWGGSNVEVTYRGLAFMRSLGINLTNPSTNQINLAQKEAENIPFYPDPDCVKQVQDFIVVRMSESLF
jgi:hypothetical protein